MKTETNITELELKVLTNIMNSEYMDYNKPEDMINNSVWSFSVTNSTNQLKGALGSCVKKGLVECDGTDITNDDSCCCLTAQGFQVLKDKNLIK